MQQRVLTADYPMPPASPELQDLLRRMLVVDPAQRATIPDIVAHPWFTMHRSQNSKNVDILAENQRFMLEDQPRACSAATQQFLSATIRTVREARQAVG